MKHWFLLFIIPIVFFSTGCQQRDTKKPAVLRCIYDQSVFADICRLAVADEKAFADFKRDPFYSLLYEGYSYEEGCESLRAIEQECPSLLAHLDNFRSSDLIGNPRTYDYGKYGTFSPTTLHHVQVAGMIQKKIGLQMGRRILQIGAEYGGLCKILHDLGLWDTYAIVDLPEHLALARKTLERHGISHVQFYTLDEVPDAFDLVVSDVHFSEFSRPLQKMFIERILSRARAGLVLGHVFPKHFGVEPLNLNELKSCSLPQFEMHQTEGERANYYFLWKEAS
jgi:hypothetical protein